MSGDPELERFKALNLGEVAVSYSYALDRRESSRSSLVMRHADGDKIIIATGEDGHAVFFSVHADASGSVIDFIMHRQGGSLGYARKTLRAYSPSSFPTAHTPAILKPRPIPHDRAALVAKWHKMRPYAGGYLESQGLTAATLAAFAERIRAHPRALAKTGTTRLPTPTKRNFSTSRPNSPELHRKPVGAFKFAISVNGVIIIEKTHQRAKKTANFRI